MTVHSEKRVIHHRPEDLYHLVADLRSYPEFLPWCLAARIRQKSTHDLTADLIIGFNMFRERFTSYVQLDPDTLWKSMSPMPKGRLNICAINGCFIPIQMAGRLSFTWILNLIHGYCSRSLKRCLPKR